MRTGRAALAFLAVLAALAAGCGGDDDGGDGGGGGGGGGSLAELRGETLTVWSNEFQPDRVRALERSLEGFTRRTQIKARVVPIPEDQLSTLVTNATAAGELPDVIAGMPVADAQAYAQEEILDVDAADQVVDRLGRGTFSEKALELVSRQGKATGVPSDGWGQLLIYRRDLFDQAGLDEPRTLEDVRAAAERLNRDGMAGITLATAPGDGFTAETFEHVALAAGCQLVDDAGEVTLTSPQCVDAFRWYADVARNFSVSGAQDVDSTRGTYFAGRAAMVFWSPFLLDGMAGLREDTRPSCPECRRDPAFLAKNSGLVGPIAGGEGGQPTQFGVVSTFGITVDARTAGAQALVEYMMSDGYLDWLGLSPQGKYPVRLGDEEDPERFAQAWSRLRSGVDTKARLSEFYSEASIESLKEGVQNFSRWGFPQGQGALVGALGGEQPVATAVADAVGGKDPAEAAEQAQTAVQEIQSGLE